MISFIRRNKVATVILTVLRVFLGIGWFQAGWDKLFGPESPFSAAGFMAGGINQDPKSFVGLGSFVNKAFVGFLRAVSGAPSGTVKPTMLHTGFFNFVVPVGELLVGLGLITGTLTIAAAFFGLIMNLSYSFAGSVSVNPTYIVLEFLFLMGGFNTGKIGLDYWVTPWLREHFKFLNNDIPTRAEAEKA
jgi:thiosulfate dehydrogenase [quinone] large subunit